MPSATISNQSTVRSEFCSFPSRNGKSIAASIDRPDTGESPRHVVVMSPKYGESKKNNLQLAYYLAANGFTVLRFDFSSHFGESEGRMLDFTLPGAVEDTLGALDYVEERFGIRDVTLLASSLSALTAVGAAAVDRRVAHLICVVGVVNLVHTLVQVYQEDLIGGFISGKRYGVLDILGHEVDMDRFFEATIADGLHTLEGIIAAMKPVKCPVSLMPAENDVWVRMEDVEAVAASNPGVTIYPIEGAMHEVRESRAAAEESVRKIVEICSIHSFGEAPDLVIAPDRKQLFGQNRIERDRLRAARPVEEGKDEFWAKYLGKYRVMEKMDDYQQYLDLVGEQLGPFGEGEILLDAGCGNGLFGVWVLRELVQRSRNTFTTPPLYVGIDLTDSGLRDAMDKHTGAGQILLENEKEKKKPVPGLLYGRADLDCLGDEDAAAERMLRFADDCFDKIACSLLVSYLQDPERLLTHLRRLLRPGGSIIVSSMKPFCDLSAIYRDFVEQKAVRRDVESARELLRAAGAIKTKQEQGYYTFFSNGELKTMLANAGFRKIDCFSSLGNQANVAVARK